MIGRFILLCDDEYFDVACDAAKFLVENPADNEIMTTQTGGAQEVTMFARRLKKSISVRQVKP